jgi:hypothetical protein
MTLSGSGSALTPITMTSSNRFDGRINIRTFLDNHKPPDRVLPSML